MWSFLIHPTPLQDWQTQPLPASEICWGGVSASGLALAIGLDLRRDKVGMNDV